MVIAIAPEFVEGGVIAPVAGGGVLGLLLGGPTSPLTVARIIGGITGSGPFGGGETVHGPFSVGDFDIPDSVSDILDLGVPFYGVGYRVAGPNLVDDSTEISRVGSLKIQQLEFLGLDTLSGELNTILSDMSRATSISDANSRNAAAINAVGTIQTVLNTLLSVEGSSYKGLAGIDILDEFNRLDIISFNEVLSIDLIRDLGSLRTAQGQIQQEINQGITAPDNTIANQQFSIDARQSKLDIATSALSTARSGLRGFFDVGFIFPPIVATPSPVIDASPLPTNDIEATATVPDGAISQGVQQPINVTVNITGSQSTLGQNTGQKTPTQQSTLWKKIVGAGQVASGIHTAVTLPFTIANLLSSPDELPIFSPINGSDEFIFPDFPIQDTFILPQINLPEEDSFSIEELADENIVATASMISGKTMSYLLIGLLIAYAIAKRKGRN